MEQSHGLVLEPIITELQKLQTESRILTESNRRMKQEIMGKDPRFDMDRLMHESNQAVANATVKRGEVIRNTSPIQGRITS